MKKFFLTTPLYYPNARPHVGSAYTTIVCDVIARYRRMCGDDVAFLTGTDEHGEKLERAAAAAGMTPQAFVAEKRQLFVDLWKKLGIEYSHFVYTDQPDHVTSVQRILRLAQKHEPSVIYKGQYQGRYCVSDERYISDGAEPANCDICGRPAELISEENYFFRLSQFGGEDGPLMKLYRDNPGFVQPEYRMNEVKSFVRSGLRDISVSRKRIKWGIPWPDDPEQVFYVWYDALTGYLTGLGYAQDENGGPDFQKYWMGTEGGTEAVHMIGKDILRFHAVYWPAFLMAARLPLPKTVFAHGWVYYEQEKMSKSKGNVVYPEPIVDALDSFGAPGNDALRYYLLREAPFGQDMSFSYEGLIQRYNSDLANDLGNLANRTITMIRNYLDGVVPAVPLESGETLGWGAKEPLHFHATVTQSVNRVQAYFNGFELSRGIEEIWHLVATTNYYLADVKPWSMAQDPSMQKHVANVVSTCYEVLRFVAVLVHPVLPASTRKLWEQLGLRQARGPVAAQRVEDLVWGHREDRRPEVQVGKPEPIFPDVKREKKEALLAKLYEFAEADRERDKPAAGALREAPLQANPDENDDKTGKPKEKISMESKLPSPEPQISSPESRVPSPGTPAPSPQPAAPAPEKISIEDFAKVEMRTGEVTAAERVQGANKLLKLQVDIGTEVRQVVAGIAEYYEPEKLIGMKVVVVTNLQPRKLRGVESNGMIVAASVGEQGRPVLVTFREDLPNGARLK
ncbi:MAG: methionine--tRNA ligase [Acidobacteriia bacterium]|nr:methionine--tRNA ligase [Terriglobia bacterium]